MGINLQKCKFFFFSDVMNGGEEHTAGLNTHHRSRREIDDSDAGLADELFRLVVSVDAGKDCARSSRAP